MIKVLDLITYPLKSARGIKVDEIKVEKTGFQLDRYFAVINSKNKIITARENPVLLKITINIIGEELILSYSEKTRISINLNEILENNIELSLFDNLVYGFFLNKKVDEWLSDVLEEKVRLVKIDKENLLAINNTDFITFNDVFPIHLISVESVEDLNKKLDNPIEINRFRPNIIVSGVKPYEEETWKWITIGDCEFEVISKTGRCSLITIDPITTEKNKQQEPLRTLSTYKKENKKVNFGVYLIPRNKQKINITDIVRIKI